MADLILETQKVRRCEDVRKRNLVAHEVQFLSSVRLKPLFHGVQPLLYALPVSCPLLTPCRREVLQLCLEPRLSRPAEVRLATRIELSAGREESELSG